MYEKNDRQYRLSNINVMNTMSSLPVLSTDTSGIRVGKKRKRREVAILESSIVSREGVATRSRSSSKHNNNESKPVPSTRRYSKRIIANHLRSNVQDDQTVSVSQRTRNMKAPKRKKELHRKKNKTKMRKKDEKPIHKKKCRRRVVVIGAGISGLAAAMELIERDYDVLVLEARNRPGGRLKTVSIHLSKKSNQNKPTTDNVCPTDVGGAFIHGIHKNPIYNLVQRLGITTRAMNTSSTHTLLLQYDNAGWPVRAEIDAKVQARFNNILAEALDYVQRVLQLQKNSKNTNQDIQNSATASINAAPISPNKHITNGNEENHKTLAKKQLILTPSTSFGTLFYYLASIGDLKKIQPNIKIQTSGKTEQEFGPQDVSSSNNYYSMEDALFQWHLANLELSSGTTLENLGLQWNEDEPYGFNGHHVILKEGFGAVIDGLINTPRKRKAFIKYGVEVSKIRILSKKNMEIVTAEGFAIQTHHVICTLPLGVLAIPKGQIGHVEFDPPLSNKKKLAIERLGFGHYNKCVLSFPRVFWMDDDFIGVIASPVAGTNILIKNIHVLHGVPVIIFMFGGNFAKDMEDLSDITIVSECMDVLQRISRKKEIPPPTDYVVTRWGKDRYARGAFSYVPSGVNGFQEYTALSEPIYDDDIINKTSKKDITPMKNTIMTRSKTGGLNDEKSSSKRKLPLILFAGEATTPFHPSTIHGAYLSGIREAYRLDLCLEPESNNHVEFDNTFLYRRTFSVKCAKIGSSKKKASDSKDRNESKSENSQFITTNSNQQVSRNDNNVDKSNISQRQRLNSKKKKDSLIPLRKSQRSMANDKRIFYGDSDSGQSSTNNSDDDYSLLRYSNAQEVEAKTHYRKRKDSKAFTKDDDLALLRGVDTFGSDEVGLKEIQLKSFPLHHDLFEETLSTKSLQSLKHRYEKLVRLENNQSTSTGNWNNDFEEIKKGWMVPNGTGCWLTHIIPKDANENGSKSTHHTVEKLTEVETTVRRSGRKTIPKAIFDI